MSANICWRPVESKAKRINTSAPSSFMEAMKRAGMSLPCELNASHRERLIGLAASHCYDTPTNPYQQLLDLLEKHESIALWAEY